MHPDRPLQQCNWPKRLRFHKNSTTDENPEYADIVVKVTGYSAHFVLMDKEFRNNFV